MTEVFLKNFEGFEVKVTSYGNFYAYKEGSKKAVYSGDTMAELEEKIKRHISNARHFKPIDVIHVRSGRVGRITSKVADREEWVFFTHKANPDERASRSEQRLIDYSNRYDEEPKPEFARVNPTNLAILKAIEKLDVDRAAIRAEQDKLRGTFTDLVTWDDIEPKGAKK